MTTSAPTASDIPFDDAQRRDVIAHSLVFIAGFTLIFIIAGATASALGTVFADYRTLITRIFGLVIIVLGLNMLGLFRISFLAMDKRLRVNRGRVSYVGSFFVGIGFAAGWSPCIGPILAAVLGMAAETRTIAAAVGLLFVYSMGLGMPLLATAVGLHYVLPFLNRIKRFLPAIEAVTGALVVLMGIVVFTNSFLRFTGWLYQTFPTLQNVGTGPESSGNNLSIEAVFVAGLVSFISPCVLPLVPVYISYLTGQSIETLVAAYDRRPVVVQS
ncbi:MAG: cytochrome c biogenesis protein CcdA [Candidatus Eremiobacteraeota bacterium]|nr:cytochrome c biogenesis protein CcdA [Candidatus Eremiobacteraeota bacterium]MBC5826767.1 cytochrome c biogenesis protein CcdA [Candidatus Eremiobacteraeota bacterium]